MISQITKQRKEYWGLLDIDVLPPPPPPKKKKKNVRGKCSEADLGLLQHPRWSALW